MAFSAVNKFIEVRVTEKENVTSGGIVLTSPVRSAVSVGTVVSAGADTGVEIGFVVVIRKTAGIPSDWGTIFIVEDDILAVEVPDDNR